MKLTGASDTMGAELVSLCSLRVGDEIFGIDTRSISEVLGRRELRRVPLAPAFIGGVVPYRGEVLTTVNFRALLGFESRVEASCVLVLDDGERGERFGLLVDRVGGVVTALASELEPNPTTLTGPGKLLFDGAYKMADGLIINLDPTRLRPGRLQLYGRSAVMAAEVSRESADCG